MVWIWVNRLITTVWCLVRVYLINESWMISVYVVIHPLRCGLPILLRCGGLSKVRCGGEGLVLYGVWQVLESAKDLFLIVDCPPPPPPSRTTCAAMCPIWNDLLNKLVHSGMCLAGGCRFQVYVCHSGNTQGAIGETVVTLTHCNETGWGLSVSLPEP
jgi:hypothetical protein